MLTWENEQKRKWENPVTFKKETSELIIKVLNINQQSIPWNETI